MRAIAVLSRSTTTPTTTYHENIPTTHKGTSSLCRRTYIYKTYTIYIYIRSTNGQRDRSMCAFADEMRDRGVSRCFAWFFGSYIGHIHVYVYVCMYIYRQRERKIDRKIRLYQIYLFKSLYIYSIFRTKWIATYKILAIICVQPNYTRITYRYIL